METNKPTTEEGADETSLVSHTTTRRVMKHFLLETRTVSNEAVACLSKATEHFMLHLIDQVVHSTESSSATREIKYDDLVRVVHSDPMCEFLSEIIPNVKLESIHTALKKSGASQQPSKKQKVTKS